MLAVMKFFTASFFFRLAAGIGLLLLFQFATGKEAPAAKTSAKAKAPALRFETSRQLHDFNVRAFENVRNAFGLSRVRIYLNPLHSQPLYLADARVESVSLVSEALSKSLDASTFLLRPDAKDRQVPTVSHPSFVASEELGDKEEATFRSLSASKPIVHAGSKVWGALFVKQECIRCHKSYKAGSVIGAFVYELSAPAPKPTLRPAPSPKEPLPKPEAGETTSTTARPGKDSPS